MASEGHHLSCLFILAGRSSYSKLQASHLLLEMKSPSHFRQNITAVIVTCLVAGAAACFLEERKGFNVTAGSSGAKPSRSRSYEVRLESTFYSTH